MCEREPVEVGAIKLEQTTDGYTLELECSVTCTVGAKSGELRVRLVQNSIGKIIATSLASSTLGTDHRVVESQTYAFFSR